MRNFMLHQPTKKPNSNCRRMPPACKTASCIGNLKAKICFVFVENILKNNEKNIMSCKTYNNKLFTLTIIILRSGRTQRLGP